MLRLEKRYEFVTVIVANGPRGGETSEWLEKWANHNGGVLKKRHFRLMNKELELRFQFDGQEKAQEFREGLGMSPEMVVEKTTV